ncbi:hypothetical protein F0L68_17980 [Solihabitans fulvus]|uniref:Calcineurin-like phosphoesterase n=1 Tax=Solihabitans fulvus TaxID=1892852 RepID=A0A5B2XEE8_9PSEU|nr:phosphodiester glycosidase family protein [Solihabitans fulvus]KAA2261331.1 hypothetical protein F0L68_17980 [Solihabitans fulvus]
MGRRILAVGVALLVSAGLFAGVAQAAPPGSAPASARDWLPATPVNWPVVVDQSRTEDRTVTRGAKTYAETYDTVGGRQHTHVLDLDLSDRNLRLGVVEAGDVLSNPADETVSSMADRTHAVAGVNGDYFEIHASGRPLGGVITGGQLRKSPRPDYNAQLGVRADGSMVIGAQTYTGTITVGGASHELRSVNVVNDLADGAVTRVTPDLGDAGALPATAVLALGHRVGDTLVVDEVRTGLDALPALPAGQEGLLGSGDGGAWLTGHLAPGASVSLAERVAPDGALRELISGATMLVRDGKPYDDPTGTPPGGINPETAVGISEDGRHAVFAVLDGRAGQATATGVSPHEVAGYLIAHGAHSAILLDGGGSTELVARRPGDAAVSVQNSPSDGTERPVANGIFVYSTAQSAGPASSVVVNDGRPVTTVAGGTIPVPVRATDRLANPATGGTDVRVLPPDLGSWADGRLTLNHAGHGMLVARNGFAFGAQPLTVVDRLDSLTVDPAAPDVNNGGNVQLTLRGTGSWWHTPVEIPPDAASWTVDQPALGGVDATGKFVAADTGSGLVTVTATVGGASATATVAVGKQAKLADDLSDVATWRLRNTTGVPAALSLDTGALPPGVQAPGSLRLDYTMPAGAGVKQLVLSSTKPIELPRADNGQNPTGIGLWVRGDRSGIQLAESYLQVDGAAVTMYPTKVTWQDWRFVVADLPPGLKYPLRLSFLDFLSISPSRTTTGTLNVSALQALYSPRPIVAPTYVPIPANPPWLHYSQDAAAFRPGGATLLVGDDAHLLAGDPESAGSHVLDAVGRRIATLAPQAKPVVTQALGDMSDNGDAANLDFAKGKLAALGVPFHDAVGNHEIGQGATPENQNFRATFGDTQYAYTQGAARVVVTDSAHGSLLSSDPFQSPARPQYPWLVDELTNSTSPTVLLVTHMPAYDPHPLADSQFSDRWEARMYVRLAQRFQQTHPGRHVAMLYGHARGFAEQVLNPDGTPGLPGDGVPQLTFADLGMPAYAPADQGGFYHFGLVNVARGGDVSFSVEPVLSSIAVAAPGGPLTPGQSVALAATGTAVGGDNLPALTLPVATPASHVWTSSDPGVLSVDAVTGKATTHRTGSATVRVASGGVTGSVTLTVTGR